MFYCLPYFYRVWRPTLVVTGIDGLPPVHSAANVLRPETSFRISVRLPPTLDSHEAAAFVRKRLSEDPPYGAEVDVMQISQADGWNAPSDDEKLNDLLVQPSRV